MENKEVYILFLYFTLSWGILARLNEFVLLVWGECHMSYAQSMRKVLVLCLVYGIGPTVVNMWCSVANVLKRY